MRQLSQDPYGAVRVAAGRHCAKAHMPLGTVVIRRDTSPTGRRICSRFVKVNEDFPTGRRWKAYARWWWENNKGAVPPGKLVLHKDGDTLNDDPSNFILGTSGMKLIIAHKDKAWSKDQHARAAVGIAELNRRNGRANRATRLLADYWYPVVDDLSTILNVPFRRRKRLVACFGADVSKYPGNGHGKKSSSIVQKAFLAARILPVRGKDLAAPRYRSFGVLDPASKTARGPMSISAGQLAVHLDRMGIWAYAEKYSKKDLKERK